MKLIRQTLLIFFSIFRNIWVWTHCWIVLFIAENSIAHCNDFFQLCSYCIVYPFIWLFQTAAFYFICLLISLRHFGRVCCFQVHFCHFFFLHKFILNAMYISSMSKNMPLKILHWEDETCSDSAFIEEARLPAAKHQ